MLFQLTMYTSFITLENSWFSRDVDFSNVLACSPSNFFLQIGPFRAKLRTERWPFSWPFVKPEYGYFWPYFDPIWAICKFFTWQHCLLMIADY